MMSKALKFSQTTLTPMENHEPEPPIIVTLDWSCGLAIGPPRWEGTESYECPECPGEGQIALPWDEIMWDEEGGFDGFDGFGEVYCTSCGQGLFEHGVGVDHFGLEGAKAKHARVVEARKKRAEADGKSREGSLQGEVPGLQDRTPSRGAD
jgi:predicted RNA-binding Zn-ribbon protein involved in translation (DUF1610 family)